MEKKVIYDDALDGITVESFSDTVFVTPEEGVVDFALRPDKAVELADVLYEAAEEEKPNVPLHVADIPFNEAILRVAAAHGHEVKFGYSKGRFSSIIEPRRLVPKSFSKAQDGTVIVTGYDPDRQDTRAYRLDRVKGDVGV